MTTLTTEQLLERFRIEPTRQCDASGKAMSLVDLLAEQAAQKALQREQLKRRVKAARAAKSIERARIALVRAKFQINEIRSQRAVGTAGTGSCD